MIDEAAIYRAMLREDLKRLEEADVKPDFIVANSMGAIVALLYATGMAPADIESIISTTPSTS